MPGGLELVADQAQAQQEDPEVVAGRGRVVGAPLAAGGPGVAGLGGERQDELDVGLDLPGMQGAVEVAELDGVPELDVVQVQPVVTVMWHAT